MPLSTTELRYDLKGAELRAMLNNNNNSQTEQYSTLDFGASLHWRGADNMTRHPPTSRTWWRGRAGHLHGEAR